MLQMPELMIDFVTSLDGLRAQRLARLVGAGRSQVPGVVGRTAGGEELYRPDVEGEHLSADVRTGGR